MTQQPYVEVNGLVETDEAKLSKQLFDSYSSSQSTWESYALQDRDFYNGNQWSEKAKRELKRLKQFPIVVNVIKPAVEQAKALLTTNKPRFSSTGREDSDTKVGKLFSDLLTYIWDISYGNVELKKVIEDYYVEGRGIGIAYYDANADFGKGEIFWKSLNPRMVYPDPNSRDMFWRDAAHILVAEILTEEQAKARYGIEDFTQYERYDGQLNKSNYSSNDDYITFTDNYHNKLLLIDRYTKIKVPQYHIIDTDNKEHVFNFEQYNQWIQQRVAIVTTTKAQNILYGDKAEEMIVLIEQLGVDTFHYVMDENGQPVPVPGYEEGQEGEIPESTTQVEVKLVANLIEEGLIPVEVIELNRIKVVSVLGGKEIANYILEIEDYPFLVLLNHWDRNPYPRSDVSFVRPLQQYVNKIRSLIIAHASNSVNMKWWLPRGSMNKKELEEGFNRAGTFIGEYDADLGEPKPGVPPPLPNELYKNEADARRDIQEILGIYPLMQGDANQAPPTYKGTIAIDEYGQRRIKSKKDDIEYALNHFAKVIVQLIQAYYTEYKAIRLIQPDNSVKTVEINIPIYDDITGIVKNRINDVTVGKYDVVVVSGSMLPSNRWAQFDYYFQLYQAQVIDQVELLKKTEIVDTEGVLERMSHIKALENEIMRLQQELKQVLGDKQTTDRENLHLKQKVETEKFKANLAKQSSKVEMAGQLYKARLDDELRNTKQQIKKGKNNNGRNNKL